MKTPNVYCATCCVPLGVGVRYKYKRYFCGDYCERAFPGHLSARNAVIRSLYYGAMRHPGSIAQAYGLTRQGIEKILKGK